MIIPFSLLLALDVLKILQTFWIQNDSNMEYVDPEDENVYKCICVSKTMHEDLGQVKMIFTDKTGTLTDNELEFRSCIIGDKIYGMDTTVEECEPTKSIKIHNNRRESFKRNSFRRNSSFVNASQISSHNIS